MNIKKHKIAFICLTLMIAVAVVYKINNVTHAIARYKDTGRTPSIYPDYTQILIPPNIAPLNFVVNEKASEYLIKIYTDNDPGISVHSKTPAIKIPLENWRKLLASNNNAKLFLDVYTKNPDGDWLRYSPITNTIAGDAIDQYLVYRKMTPSSFFPKEMLIQQRDLASYKEKSVLNNASYDKGCVNCHTFLNKSPEYFTLGIRSLKYGMGTLLIDGGNVKKIDIKLGYASIHPSGKLTAFSINDVRQFFHAFNVAANGVLDHKSALSYYDFETKKIKITPQFSDPNRLETYPAWSPDGCFLYFSAGDVHWRGSEKTPPDNYQQIRYDLQRIPYDIRTDTWGQVETIIDADAIGKSILLPRISPDGKFLLFCMTDYGCFPIYQPESDLYLMDLQTRQYKKLPVNSERTEAWHSFSSNSKWIVFSSKRRDGIFTRLYLAHIDDDGNASKPFIIPQKDPLYYDSLMMVYSLPEFIKAQVKISSRKLTDKARSGIQAHVNQVITGATPSSSKPNPWEHPQ